MTKPTDYFEKYMHPTGERNSVLSKPQRVLATKKAIRDIQDATGIDDYEKATEVADWYADRLEAYGMRFARPVFEMDGSGPVCSFCGTSWPFCGCHHHSVAIYEDKNGEEDA